MTGVDCVVKRNWVMLTVSEDILDQTTFNIILVGVRNTEGTDAHTFNILFMEPAADGTKDHQKASQYYYTTYTFGETPAAYMDLLNVTIDYKDNSNALASKDDYEFWFTVFADGTTAKTVTVKMTTGKFVVTLPD